MKLGIKKLKVAIQAATRTAAQAIMRINEIGTRAKGKQADFLLMTKNPLACIDVLIRPNGIEAVYKAGEPVIR